ncbi:uncharacterized protein LOC126839504 isoform X2 [Adelges cooleyi]|uniref:uncharacterized protein LOC126839504 isoform X2 n=1 Tax=Adelges cooleyi TaxID=133065 RepID=UPI0021801436|nr:uncharacterized protein LOC126839504 isoform X2 [Adelges cooleyi]
MNTMGADWRSYPSRQIVYNRYILKGLQYTPTLEKDKIYLTDHDIDLLSAADRMYSVERTKAVKKLSRKAEALQCTNGLVIRDNLQLLRTVNNYHIGAISQNDTDLTRILALFYMLDTSVRNCFWRIHIKIKAYLTLYSSEPAKLFFSDLGKYIDDIDEYCQRCKRDGLMIISQTPDPETLPAPDLEDKIDQALAEPKKLFELQNYTLDHWGDQITRTVDDVCESFSQVLWTNAKTQMLGCRKARCLESLNCTWYMVPYGYVRFQKIVLRIIQANVTYRAWVHLKTYAAYAERHNLEDPAEIRNWLTTFWLLLRDPLSSAVDLLDLRHGVLWSLTYHMATAEEIDEDTLNSMIQCMRNQLEAEYLKLEVPKWQWGFNALDLELSETTDFESDMVIKNTALLQYYVERVRTIFLPLDIHFVRFFLSGEDA